MSEIPDAGGAAVPSEAPPAPVEVGGHGVHAARQPVVRVRGARRARLMPAPGTTAEPAPADDPERGAATAPAASGPNDDRMRRDVPPHY